MAARYGARPVLCRQSPVSMGNTKNVIASLLKTVAFWVVLSLSKPLQSQLPEHDHSPSQRHLPHHHQPRLSHTCKLSASTTRLLRHPTTMMSTQPSGHRMQTLPLVWLSHRLYRRHSAPARTYGPRTSMTHPGCHRILLPTLRPAQSPLISLTPTSPSPRSLGVAPACASSTGFSRPFPRPERTRRSVLALKGPRTDCQS